MVACTTASGLVGDGTGGLRSAIDVRRSRAARAPVGRGGALVLPVVRAGWLC